MLQKTSWCPPAFHPTAMPRCLWQTHTHSPSHTYAHIPRHTTPPILDSDTHTSAHVDTKTDANRPHTLTETRTAPSLALVLQPNVTPYSTLANRPCRMQKAGCENKILQKTGRRKGFLTRLQLLHFHSRRGGVWRFYTHKRLKYVAYCVKYRVCFKPTSCRTHCLQTSEGRSVYTWSKWSLSKAGCLSLNSYYRVLL